MIVDETTVLVGLPVHDQSASQWWVHWLTNRWMPQGALLIPVVGSLVHDARNQIVERALRIEGWKTLVMIDADVFPPPHEESDVDALALIRGYQEHDLAVVGPLCFGRSMLRPTPVAGYFSGDSTYERLTPDEVDSVSAAPGLYTVDVLGLGLVSFQRRVFEQLEPPWFYHPVANGQVLGEDVQLYRRLKQVGIPVYLDSRWHALHLGHLYYGRRTYALWRSLGGARAASQCDPSPPEASTDR